ncbi:MAG TPA: hypothetical protein DCR55_05650 [Lentisphaeria bacterium]|nr:hypothetical protein [Lentisphaeria bacterium]
MLLVTLMTWPAFAQQDAPKATAQDVVVIPLQDVIDRALLHVLRRGFKEAEEAGVKAVVIDMKTPGGGLKETEEIIQLIRSCRSKGGIPVYTFVNPSAISAGAITAMSCDGIFMSPGATIGDAMPIMMTNEGPKEVTGGLREKIFSPTRALVRALAQENGYSEEMAVAMVDPDVELVIGDEVLCKKGQLLTLTAEEACRVYAPMETPLLARGIVNNIEELLELIDLGGTNVVRVEVTKSERIAQFLTSPFITSIVMMCILLGLYAEMQSPGIGMGAGIAGVALAIFLFGHSVAGLAGKWDMVLIVVGLALLAAEVFVLPGFGICGVLGLGTLFAGLVMTMMPHWPTGIDPLPNVELQGLSDYFSEAIRQLALVLVLTVIGGIFLSKVLPKSRFYKKLVLEAEQLPSQGYVGLDVVAQMALVGKHGTTQSPLRPSGIALIDGKRVDVVSEGEFIDRDTAIEVTHTEGARIVVAPLPDPPADEESTPEKA